MHENEAYILKAREAWDQLEPVVAGSFAESKSGREAE